MRDKTRNQGGGLNDFWVKRVFLLTDRQVSTTRLGVLLFFYPNVKTSSIMPPDAGDPMVKPKSTSAHNHRRTLPFQDWGVLSFFNPTPGLTCLQMLATHWSSLKAREHIIMDAFVPTFFFGFWNNGSENFFFPYQTNSDFALKMI
jgi:hypothetical protein